MYRLRHFLIYVGFIVVLVGCGARFERQMTEDVHQLVGKDIHVAISKLGYPSREETIAGDHLFRWSINGGSTGTATTIVPGLTNFSSSPSGCAIDLVVDKSNVVNRAAWAGDRRTCGDFEDKLEE
jgi:hypothetical protein